MIDIISLEKVLIDFIKVLNSEQLSCFKKNIFDILNSEDINKNNHEMINPDIFQIPNKKDNVCNYPRTKNRGPCKRRCINNIHCIYHENKNTTKEYIDKKNDFHVIPSISYNIPCKSNSENDFIPQLLEYNELEEIDQYDKIIFPKFKKYTLKYKNNKCLFIEDVTNTTNKVDNVHVIPYNPDKNILPVQIEIDSQNIKTNNPYNLNLFALKNTEVIKNTTKKKKKKPRYIKEYNILCNFYNSQIKPKIYNYNINIRTKILINRILNYEDNKTKNKNNLSCMLFSAINTIAENENLENQKDDFKYIFSYIYALSDVLKTDNYNDEDFNEIKNKII